VKGSQRPTVQMDPREIGRGSQAPLCAELCTEAEHEPVDSLVHEILVASSTDGDYVLTTNRTETRSREGISGFFPIKTIISQNG
jgi:hypothetical protein